MTFGRAGDLAAAGDYDGDGRPDLAVFDPDTAVWTIRSGTDGAERTLTFGPSGAGVVPVTSPLFFRLVATGNAAPAAPQPARPVTPGDTVAYGGLAFYPDRWAAAGISTVMVPWEGRNVVLLTTDAAATRR